MDKKYILAIDTTNEETGIGLVGENRLRIVTWISHRNQSKELLPNINKLLKKEKISPAELKWIVVNLGPGSFTGLRVGVSTANTLGYGLNIAVIGKANLDGEITDRIEALFKLKTLVKKFKQVLPHYGRPPRITLPKKQ
ncbi:tRNA (adenosine(37)-N6)-threonylcarbamoyltransferase complex dimerization subunit type 1 TsaB [Patescibacteria group bacterium]|nr:tRNA (adenosine(37)-N6)-threonylcarbamoyltransferase complex dimerization subunit type 1 TsaB [Patescibacteria group bacterium]